MKLPRIPVLRRTGKEPFHRAGRPSGFDLLSFWQWHASDLTGNALRGCIAEFLVAQALGLELSTREEWDEVDLRLPSGHTVEVKSAAYHQSWPQRRESTISFDIAPKRGWHAPTNVSREAAARTADVYVFCLLAHRDRNTIDPLDLDQWVFHVLSRTELERRRPGQKKIQLAPLLSLGPHVVGYDGLAGAVALALRS